MKNVISPVLLIWLTFHCTVATSENTSKPIKLITNNWTSQIVLAHITGEIFQSMNFPVEYVNTAVADQWGALSHGIAHVQVEVWEGTMADMFNKMLKKGSIVDAGNHKAKTREDWWYPMYVEESCPGLPDWRALNACAAIFAPKKGESTGIYYSGPWEKPDEARIRALGMNFRIKVLARGDDLWVVLKKAFAVRQPVVLFNWTPNWVESRYKGRFVEFPEYAPECESDPRWGTNQHYIYDCGNPKHGWLKKVAWSGMKDHWDCAYRTLLNISLDNKQFAYLSALVDADNLSHTEAAQIWLQDNDAIWTPWIPEDCKGDLQTSEVFSEDTSRPVKY